MAVRVEEKYIKGFVSEREIEALSAPVALAHQQLHEHTGLGSDFLGWLRLPEQYDRDEVTAIREAAKRIQSNSDVLIVIGIAGRIWAHAPSSRRCTRLFITV